MSDDRNVFEPEHTGRTQLAVDEAVEGERAFIMGQVWRWVMVGAGVVTALGALVGLIAFGYGRASADDLSSTNTRVTRFEQVLADHITTHVESDRRSEKKFDTIDVKLDRLFEQSAAIARHAGARELTPPPKHVVE